MDWWKRRRGGRSGADTGQGGGPPPPPVVAPVGPSGQETLASSAVGAAEAADSPPPPAGASWQVGGRVADLYEVRDVLGQGAMGVVYRVRHLGWDVDLAVKSPRPELFATEADQQRFVQEAETWVSLGLHPHVCSCHYVRTLGGIPRVFAEYVAGGSLRAWIDDRRLYEGGPRTAVARILDLAIQAAWGLAHAHGHRVVHQDVKPANILVDSEGTAKITDFGLARSQPGGRVGPVAPAGGTILVTTGGRTPAYASPEQAAGQRVGRRSDIWSFAVSVLEMFTGEVTWLAGQVAGAALAEYRERGVGDGMLVAMPALVAEVLADCLQDDPAQRPTGIAEVAARLVEVYQREVGGRYPRPEPVVADLRADELNNRALSLLDLDRVDDARAAFDQARAVDPQHLEATFNLGLLGWRSGRLRDDEFVAELAAVRARADDSWQAKHLLAQVHLERGDPEAALPLLAAAASEAPDDAQVRADLQRARSGAGALHRIVCTLTGHDGKPVFPTHLSADRHLALSWKPDRTVVNDVGIWDTRTGRQLPTLRHPSKERTDFPRDERISAVCLSKDGSRMLAGSTAGALYLWRTDTGDCLRTLDEDASRIALADHIVSLCLSDNGGFALSCDLLEEARLWDLDKGHCVDTIGGVCLAGNGSAAVVGGPTGDVVVWDLNAGRRIYVLERNKIRVDKVCLSPDGRFAMSGEGGYGFAKRDRVWTARVWDLATGTCLRVLKSTSPITAVALGAEGKLALIGDDDGLVHVWDVDTDRCLRILKSRHNEKNPDAYWAAISVTSIDLSPDGRIAVTGEHQRHAPHHRRTLMRVWDLATGYCLRTIGGLCLGSDGSAVLTSGPQGRVWAWATPEDPYRCSFHPCRPTSPEELVRRRTHVETLVRKAEQAMAEDRLATAGELLTAARRVRGWERTSVVLDSWRKLARSAGRTGVKVIWPATTLQTDTSEPPLVRASPDGRVAVSAADRTMRIWELATGHCLCTIETDPVVVSALDLSTDGVLAATGGSGDHTVRVWDLITGECRQVLEGHTSGVTAVQLSADGRFVLSGGLDDTVRFWDVATGRCLRGIEARSLGLPAIALSPDVRLAVATEGKDTLRVWELATGRCLRTLGPAGPGSVAFSADGRLVISTGSVGLRVWEVATGQCLHTLQLTIASMEAVCLSADGRFVMAVEQGRIGTVQVWDIASNQCVRTIEVHPILVSSISLSGDGRFALFGVPDGEVRVWEIDWDLAVRDPADWDEGARPYLTAFLSLHTPLAGVVPRVGDLSEEQVRAALTRRGTPTWEEADFQRLCQQLQHAGYGWLRPAGVRAELERMAQDWREPPPLPGG